MARILIVSDLISGNPYARLFIDALREDHEVVCVAQGCEGETITSGEQLRDLYERPVLTRSGKASTKKKKKIKSRERSRLANLVRAVARVRRVKKAARRDALLFESLGKFDCILCVNSARLLGCVRYRERHGGKLVPCLFEVWPNQRADYSRELSRGLARIEGHCLREADKVIVPHRSWWRLVRMRYGLGGKDWVEIPNVARDENPELHPERVGGADAITVYYQGRLGTGRGLEMVVDAVGDLPGISLHLRGAGGAEEALRRQALEAGAEGRITFLDPLPPGELVDSCKPFDVGLVSFLKDSGNGKFGIGSKFFEYVAGGNAVLVPDSWPLKDWVKRYELGRVYRAGDPASLAQVLGEFVSDPESVKRWAANAARAAATDFSYKRVCERIRSELAPLLSDR